MPKTVTLDTSIVIRLYAQVEGGRWQLRRGRQRRAARRRQDEVAGIRSIKFDSALTQQQCLDGGSEHDHDLSPSREASTAGSRLTLDFAC